MIAERMNRIDASGIRKVFDLASKMTNPVNLSIGQPDFDVPDPVKSTAKDAIDNGFNKYTVTQGIPELRDAVRSALSARGRLAGHDAYDIMISSGTSGGLFLAMFALLNPGDEVLFADPYFVMYKHFVNLLDGKPVFVDTYPDFALTAERVEQYLTPKSKILIVNSPCNPTGQVYTESALKELAELCNSHGIFVLTDEIYSSFSYDQPHASIFPHVENGILLDGFSKSHAMTGWRVGYAVGPAEIIQQMNKLQQYTFVCSPSMAQKAAVTAVEYDMSATVADYKCKRDIIYGGLKDTFELVQPGGAFYAFPKAPGDSGTAFVEKAIANNLLIIPGNVFSEKDTHFRISFAADNAVLEKGIEILNSLV
jgi:aspartate aminotransferase/aminotransferase